MKAEINYVNSVGRKKAKELRDSVEEGDPDLLMLFPVTRNLDTEKLAGVTKVLREDFSCPLGGVSVGGIATGDTGGLKTHGMAMVSVEGLSFDVTHVGSVWESSVERFADVLQEGGNPKLTFEAGTRAGTGKFSWNIAKRLASYIVRKNTLGQRDRLVKRLNETMSRNNIGYSDLFYARVLSGLQGQKIINFSSSDAGQFLEGYEIWEDSVTDTESAAVLSLEDDIPTGVAGVAEDAFGTDRVLQHFDSIDFIGRFIYYLEGKSLYDLKDRYSVAEVAGRGGFTYYLILKTGDITMSLPITSDLGLVLSYVPMNEDSEAYLVRAPDFSEYEISYEEMLDGIGEGVPHISLNPPQLNFYREHITEIVRNTAERREDFILTIDNAFRTYHNFDYTFPGYIQYV